MTFQATHNGDAVSSQLRAAAASLGDLEATDAAAGDVIASRPAPRRSGQLGAGVTVAQLPGGGGVAVASTAPYFTYVHYGAPGRNVRAQPWLADQLAAKRDQIEQLYLTHADQALDQVKG